MVQRRSAPERRSHRFGLRVVALFAGLLSLAVMSSSAAAAPFRVEGKQRAPLNKSLPKITGTATEGQRLTASTGSWSGSPTSFAYSWQRCNASGDNCLEAVATTTTYDLTAADVGSTIRVV